MAGSETAAAMESTSQDRNLPASERKLQQARRDGQAWRSRDLGHLATLGTGALMLVFLAPLVLDRFRHALGHQLGFDAAAVRAPGQMLTRLADMALLGLAIALVFALAVWAVVIASSVLAGGWVASAKPLLPDFKRISPQTGLGRLFSRQQAADVAKLVLLTAILAATAAFFVGHTMHGVAALLLQPSVLALRDLADWLRTGVGLLLLVVLAAAVIDVPLQAYLHRSRLRMSHEEVKQEHKESDGNPQVKGRLRARQREIAMRHSVKAVPKADFVLMNPTHFAVALKYDEKTMAAPRVVSKGADLLAMRIRELAKAHAVPVLQSPALARALYTHAELDREIPSALYAAVAQVLAYVYRLKAALRGEGPMPPDQPDPPVPAELDPLARPATGG